MKVLLTTSGRFHTFALARELQAAGHLSAVVSAFPWYKLKREGLPRERVKTTPWVTMPRMALARIGLESTAAVRAMDDLKVLLVDRLAGQWARDADVVIGLSRSGLRTGQSVQRRGGVYICDRGSSHILYQKRILEEEAARFGAPTPVISPRAIRRELAEYEAADAITVPSEFVRRSFIEEGVPADKVHKVPYGSNTAAFHPTQTPDDDAFDVLFVGGLSLRKGLPYLFQAFEALHHPAKRLTIAGLGGADAALVRAMAPPGTRFMGHVPSHELKHVMSRSHVMVLPSIEEGLALVIGEALSCGCPVVASENTGASDLFTDGVEGFIVPIRNPGAIVDRLQSLADDPEARRRMSRAARERMTSLRGWGAYGDQMIAVCEALIARRKQGVEPSHR